VSEIKVPMGRIMSDHASIKVTVRATGVRLAMFRLRLAVVLLRCAQIVSGTDMTVDFEQQAPKW
jgi:hypothetical protein